MEKNTQHGSLQALKEQSRYQDLLELILDAVRREAQTVPAFRQSHNGCIRITIVALCEEADEWLGGGLFWKRRGHLGTEVIDVGEREFVFKIDPRGSHTVQWESPEDGHIEPVNCYGYSALKTAYAARQYRFERKALKGEIDEPLYEDQYFVEENGWSQHFGPVYATVTLDDKEFLRFAICTSGADSREDQRCSIAGMREAREFFWRISRDIQIDVDLILD